jgi:hypothetical protein
MITPETRLKLSSRSGGISVFIFDKSNVLINQFSSMTSAAKHLGISDRTIRRTLNTGISYDDYIYKFEFTVKNPIIVLNNKNNLVREYYSIRTVAKDMAVSPCIISDYINTNKLLKDIYFIYRK